MRRLLPFFAIIALTNCSSHQSETSLKANEGANSFFVRQVPNDLALDLRKNVGDKPFVVEGLFKIGCNDEGCVYVASMPGGAESKKTEKYGSVAEINSKNEATGRYVHVTFGTVAGVDTSDMKDAKELVAQFRDNTLPIPKPSLNNLKQGVYTEIPVLDPNNSLKVQTNDRAYGWSVSAWFYKIQDDEIYPVDPLASF